ncbi:ABC transporter ATP-binding protein [Micromonospora sagamiensis]|uniref:ABC-type multidrug transport system fused ATPase/permease subunit n=1 Tax=Micromonospora sagamiensis TaxID=47875 RepID=A0A562WAZ8_9ACTN|nr:ABC transporter ATP-binding protein [Micromonospora sagamiensis]TWJ27151.1 ABC-type multidrug transport system fused ATPase/permease subunit [Micromonospora sagamiensis]BCL13954.1 multidrug ABC transporter ATP-binding protein [Micromonospora sagamiensis]
MATALPVADAAQVRRYARALARRHPGALACALALHALAAAAGLAGPRLLGDLVEGVSRGDRSTPVDAIVLAIAGFVVAQSVLLRFAHIASARLGERVLAALREEFVDRILALPLATVERAGTGDLLTRTTRDVSALSRTVRLAVPETLIAVVTAAFVLGALLLVGPLLVLPCLVAVPVLVVGTRWYLRRATDGYLRENAAYSDITDGISEAVEGSRTTEALRQQARRRARTDADIRRSYAAERYTLWLRTVFFPLTEIGYLVPMVATLVVGGWFYLEGWVNLGQVTAATLYTQQLIEPVDRLLAWLDELQVGGASLARLLGVATPDGPDAARSAPDGSRPSPVDGAEPAGGLGSGRVAVREVTFAYWEGRDVLHGVTLVPEPGEKLAMVGPSGAGKSTLGRLLAGVHTPRTGSVTVDGRPLTGLPLTELRRHVALVTQEHHVFIGTLRENVAMVRPSATDADLRAALAAVDALDWAEALPDGLGTRVGAGGHPLTAAQAQQLALARLVLADPHTLVLDEATSLIDPRAARHLERSLAAVLEGRTVIAIAHRLFSAHDADRVAVVEGGRITELGSHTELLARGGSYADLWRSWHGPRP